MGPGAHPKALALASWLYKDIYELADLLGTLSVNLVYWCRADRAPTSFCFHIGFAMIFTANSTFISVLYRFHIGPTK